MSDCVLHPTLVDSHCHLDLKQFDEDRRQVMERARTAGVGLVINPGIDVAHSRAALQLAERYPNVYAAVGVHPNHSGDFSERTLDEVKALAEHPKAVAIGEIGLDTHWDSVDLERQQVAFRAQLELAATLGLPVIIHSRKTNEEVAVTLRDWVGGDKFKQSRLAVRPFAGVLHAFSGDLQMANEAYEWGFILSLGGPTTFKNARSLHRLVPQLRLNRLMLETDAPYLTPHPYRGKRNEPAHIKLICDQIAQLYGMSYDEVAAATTAVAIRFFGLEDLDGAEHFSPQKLQA